MAALARWFWLRRTISRHYSKIRYQQCRPLSDKKANEIKYSQLKERGLIKVSGNDAVKFLQGLVTNNVELFHQDSNVKSMYSMFLNVQGRALFDTIFFKLKSESGIPSFAVEHDKNLSSQLLKQMKMYKLRSKVDMSEISNLVPWVVFSDASCEVKLDKNTCEEAVVMAKDPRNDDLGIRLILPAGMTPQIMFSNATECQDGDYEKHRAKLGVCEGALEIPSGSAIPLEYNLAYLNGVSFHKGCYIGQELTARAHHTGVIRKRVMPISFCNFTQGVSLEPACPLKTSDGKSAGRVCAIHGVYGLALIRLETLKKGKLFVKDTNGIEHEVLTHTPTWWPKEEEKHSRT